MKIQHPAHAILLAVAVLAASIVTQGCATRVVPFTGRVQANSVSDARLNSQAALAYREILSGAPKSPDPTHNARIEGVSRRLIAAVERYFSELGQSDRLAEFSWEFAVIENIEPNAMCLPGGKIVVHTGLLQITTTDDHLAAVIGHEIAHALAHHVAERMTDANMMQAMTGVMSSSGSQQANQMSQLYGNLAQLGFLLPHSRFQEAEADHIGLIMMAVAGYEPAAAPDVWRKMMATYGSGRGSAFMSTHPANEQRMLQLDALVPTVMPIFRKISEERNALTKKEE